MNIEHVLAVVPVSDLDRAAHWYEALFGRLPDNRPMNTLVEWQASDHGWVQVTVDPDRAGAGLLNLAVADLADARTTLEHRGLEAGQIQLAQKGVKLMSLRDPDGNAVTLIGHFRVDY